MSKRKRQNQAEEIKKYLDTSLNLAIYDRLTKGDRVGLFEPLEFFKVFSRLYEYIKANKSKFRGLANILNGINLTDVQRNFLLYYVNCRLLEDINKDLVDDEELKRCQLIIKRELDTRKFDAKRFDFETVKQHLSTLPDDKAKIKFLINIRTEYLQDEFAQLVRRGFDLNCDLEIDRLEKLMALEQSKRATDEMRTEAIKRKPQVTMEQASLAMYYLLTYFQAKCSNVNKAKFISFLTGFSENTIRQFLSEVHLKKNDNYLVWEKNMKLVKQQLELLNWPELIKMVDNDLNSEELEEM